MISIVIPLRKSSIQAIACLNSIDTADYAQCEVVFATNRWRTAAALMAEKRRRRSKLRITVVREHREASAGKLVRAGIRRSKGELIACAGEASRFIPGALSRFSELFERTGAGIVFWDIHNDYLDHERLPAAIVRKELLDSPKARALVSSGSDWRLLSSLVKQGAACSLSDEPLYVGPAGRNSFTQTISIHAADHCNLKCVSCSHFSSVAEKRFLTPQELRSQLERSPAYKHIFLVGGEPLLNPDITELFRITHELQPAARISLVTNGILLPSMDEEFFRAVKELQVKLFVTNYPSDDPFYRSRIEAIEGFADDYGIRFWNPKTFMRMPLDENGGGNALLNYVSCRQHYPQLTDGFFYPCPASANMQALNERFGTSLTHEEGDRLALEEVASEDELWEWMLTAKPFCRYCKPWRFSRVAWGKSSGEKHEWFD